VLSGLGLIDFDHEIWPRIKTKIQPKLKLMPFDEFSKPYLSRYIIL
jgi:hypothetical protein